MLTTAPGAVRLSFLWGRCSPENWLVPVPPFPNPNPGWPLHAVAVRLPGDGDGDGSPRCAGVRSAGPGTSRCSSVRRMLSSFTSLFLFYKNKCCVHYHLSGLILRYKTAFYSSLALYLFLSSGNNRYSTGRRTG